MEIEIDKFIKLIGSKMYYTSIELKYIKTMKHDSVKVYETHTETLLDNLRIGINASPETGKNTNDLKVLYEEIINVKVPYILNVEINVPNKKEKNIYVDKELTIVYGIL